MDNHAYLTGILPSSPNATTTAINSQLPPTTSNDFQFMSQPTDQFSHISPTMSLTKGSSLYHSQHHMGAIGNNNDKNMEPVYPLQQHTATQGHTQHTWDMIQKHYNMSLVESMGTSSSSSPLPSAVKQQHSPTSLTSVNSTPPLYQEMISPSTSSSTSAQVSIDSSQPSFRLEHPPASQMARVDADNTLDTQQKLFFLGSNHTTLENINGIKSNEQQALHQQINNLKPGEQENQITQQRPKRQQQRLAPQQLHESPLSASGSILPSTSFSPSGLQRDQKSTNPSCQQKLAPAPASSNHHKASDQHTKNDPCNVKRSHQDDSAASSKGLGAPLTKKSKTDTTIQQTTLQQRKTLASLSPPHPKSTPFTATSFEHMTREQMIERLIFLENERLDLQQQLEKSQAHGMKQPKSNSTDITNDETSAKNNNNNNNNNNSNNNKTGDDDDDDDDEVESISSGTEINATTDDKTEMKCLWKNCGIIRVGIRDLTDHIVSAHVGGGKPLYRCEWENCRRSHKPFTKRHKICNHLRVHTGERPFVCDKPGCEKRFSRLDSLTTHIKTHSTVRPFICHIPSCKKEYYHARSLKKHLKLHEDEKAKENEIVSNALNTNNNSLNPPPVAFTAATSSSDPQSLQQPGPHQPYPFVEGISIPQFLLQPGSNITSASIGNDPMISQSIIDSAQSLFDPFQTLSTLPIQHNQQQQQRQPQPQSQFMQLGDNISQVTMAASANHNINIMDTLQQQQQQQQQASGGHQTGYNVSLPMAPGQPPMSQDGFCL